MSLEQQSLTRIMLHSPTISGLEGPFDANVCAWSELFLYVDRNCWLAKTAALNSITIKIGCILCSFDINLKMNTILRALYLLVRMGVSAPF